MTMSDSPRRYVVDGAGARVLIGLTVDETREFETLDRTAERLREGESGKLDQARWQQLYFKHDEAWQAWKANTVDEANGVFRRPLDLWSI
jgi:hypothetical protein